MKKLLFFAAATAIVALAACGNQTKSEGGNDSMSTDSAAIIAAPLDTAPPPAFLYYYSPDNMVVLYWSEVKKPQLGEDEDEDWAQKAMQSWGVQDRIRRNASTYTKLFYDTNTFEEVKCIGEQLKDPDGGDLAYGVIHNQWNQGAGLKFEFKNPKNKTFKEVEYGGLFVLASDVYLQTHKVLKIEETTSEGGPKPMPADIVKKLEKQYSMSTQRSEKTCDIDNRYTYGVIQFKPQGEKILAIDVICDNKEDKLYIHEAPSNYDASEPYSIWNVDDDGEYYASNIEMAFEGPQGLELCFTRSAPESLTYGLMRLKDKELVREDYSSFYVYVDEGKPFWKKDLAACTKLYVEDDPENKHNTLCKWAYIDIDNDNQDELWLCDKEEKNHAFFSRKGDTFKLLCTVDQRMSVKVYFNRISISGPAGGPAWYYADYIIKDSKVVKLLTMTEIYGEPHDCALNGKEIDLELGQKYKEEMPSKEHWLNEHYWNTFENN